MNYGYHMRTGKPGRYKYWYRDPASGLLYEGPIPPRALVARFRQQPLDPPLGDRCPCPWEEVGTNDHQRIQTVGGVLFNKLGLTDHAAIDAEETKGLLRAYVALPTRIHARTQLRLPVMRALHREVFSDIYSWAGEDRHVNVSVAGFTWGLHQFIAQNLAAFERDMLMKFTPVTFDDQERVPRIAAMIIGELLAIHPFREGNGRVARLLGDWVAVQAGLPLVKYHFNSGGRKKAYIAAVQRAFAQDYDDLEAIIRAGLPL